MQTKRKRIKKLEAKATELTQGLNRQEREITALLKFFGLVARKDRTKYQPLYYVKEARKAKEVMKRRWDDQK